MLGVCRVNEKKSFFLLKSANEFNSKVRLHRYEYIIKRSFSLNSKFKIFKKKD